MRAALPPDEPARLAALQETGLLDSAPEEEFDCLVRLASVICETPIALMTLVDSERQWFKSKIGLEAAETPRDIAFCAHAILDSELMIVPDAQLDPRFASNPLVRGNPHIRFYAGIPLETGKDLRLGTLCVIDRTPREISTTQREALRLLADQANRLIEARRARNLLESTIAQSSMVERELRASQGLFHAFMDNSPFVAFMKNSAGRMVYYNQRWAERFHIGREDWLGKPDAALWPPDVATRVAANDRTVLRQWRTLIQEEWVDSGGPAPTMWRSYKFPFKDTVGVEYVAGFAVDVTAEKQAELEVLLAKQGLEAANQKLEKLAVTDGLTDLLNRRGFESALENEFDAYRKSGHPVSLLIADIDNFKLVNDTFGHEEGDRVLRAVAGVIEGSFRGSDIVARYGGEEFAVLLPRTDRQPAVEFAERLRRAIGRCEIDPHRISVSIGVSTLQAAELTKSEFVRRADEALYEAKRGGKNRVCMG